jgi:DNA-binding NtrC family response regulator
MPENDRQQPSESVSCPLQARVLLLETDEGRGEILRGLLRSLSCRVRTYDLSRETPENLGERPWDLILCDLSLFSRLRGLPAIPGNPPLILLAPYDGMVHARELVTRGEATDWLPSPVREGRVLSLLRSVLSRKKREEQSEEVLPTGGPGDQDAVLSGSEKPAEALPVRHFGLMVGESPRMQELYRQIEKVSRAEMTVLILGESGTGKELVAKAIHNSGDRANKPFVPVNCSSLPENLLESELFGYVKGAFTGAVHNKDGLFVAAEGGTLFLDEVGSIPPSTQMALLRALQEREIRPVGSVTPRPVNVRVVAATNEDVDLLREQGRLRQDLFYRLSAFTLRLPALRERQGDLPLLIQSFLAENPGADGRIRVLSPAAREALERHSWPGNIRELLHVLQRGVTLSEGDAIRLKDLPQEFSAVREDGVSSGSPALPGMDASHPQTLKAYLRSCERQYLRVVLEEYHGNKEEAAKILGISVATLYRKLSDGA